MGSFSTLGGALPLKQSFADAVKVLSTDARDCMKLETLVNEGYLSLSDMINYINNIETDDFWAAVFNHFTTGFAASILSNNAISIGKAASILRNSCLTPNNTQAALYALVDGGFFDKLVGIMADGAPDATISTPTTLATGVNRYGTLTINSGIGLNLGAAPGVIIANTIVNNGYILSGWIKGAQGTPGAAGAGAGGDGKGGLILVARSFTIGTVSAIGSGGGNASTVSASGAGGAGGAGLFWEVSGYPAGTGGNGGNYPGYGYKNAGGGGSSSSSNRGGNGGSASVTTYDSLTALLKEIFKALCDWWLINVAGKTPSTVKSIPELGGSGGGGGGAYASTTGGASGGGGGGAGEIIIYGTSVTAGTVNDYGGVGGNGGTTGTHDAGGGGGGGGVVYVAYKTLNGSFTINVSGGAGGTGDDNGLAGGTGSSLVAAV